MSETMMAERGTAAIAEAFRRRREAGEKVLSTYIVAGDPDLGTTEKIIRSLSGIDVDLIELGMPFSDPLADGAVVQRAAQRSLRQGTNLKKVLHSVQELRLMIDTPIVIMTYYNLFLSYGLEQFAEDAARAGIDGLIIPDLPAEEAEDFLHVLDRYKLALVPLIAPTSSDDRIKMICAIARGFIYYVSRTGVTGMQKDIADDLYENLMRVRKYTDLPIAVGFGVSTPEQARKIAHHADGVVIGSAIVRVIEETQHMHDRVVAKFVKPIIDMLHTRY
ncbi:MAG: tryptophan synthase subunit alpha [bacterium]|jgi:tryptophan synthase alpha chain